MISYYELLGMIKNKKNPKKIKFDNDIYIWNNVNYECEYFGDYLCSQFNESEIFEKNIEIIVDGIEELKIENDSDTHFYIRNEHGTKCSMTKHSKIIAEKLNEVIREVNKLRNEIRDK